ncbi:type VII secretion-associated serine protease mycosin [Kitasatospora sp. NPDC054939]
MTSSRLARGAAVLAAGALLWGSAVSPAAADQIRDAQWALKKYEAEARIWPLSQGEGVVVAVIDSGVSQSHQDLVGQVLPGADFSKAGTDGRSDSDGHGTAMASLIAGRGHGSGAGVMGLAPKAKILPIRLSSENESSNPQQNGLALAIRYAVDHGAKVISMSVGGASRFDSVQRSAVNYAVSKDVVLVAAAGNNGQENPVEYPAAFPGVVAVGAVDSKGTVWDRSTPGPETTLVGPGADVYHASTKTASGYAVGEGTSGATAYVSATAALIRSKYPELSAGQVINRMIKSATPPPDASPVPNSRYGYGILAPAKALEPDPVVDRGPRENPLLGRVESQGTPPGAGTAVPAEPTEEPTEAPWEPGANGNPGITYTLVGLAVLVAVVLVWLVLVLWFLRRRRRRALAQPPVPQGAGVPEAVPPGYGYPPPPPGQYPGDGGRQR